MSGARIKTNVGPRMGMGVAVGAGDGLGSGEATDLRSGGAAAAAVVEVDRVVPAQAAPTSATSAARITTADVLERSIRYSVTDSTQPLGWVLTTYAF